MTTIMTRSGIDEFLAQRRLAVVGVSRDPKDFTHTLFRDLRRYGYQAIPVNPHAEVIEGEHCYARVQDIVPPVNSALILTPPAINEAVMRDCAEAGIRRVWLHGIGERSEENAAAIAVCEANGITVIPGFCPYMFLRDAAFYHKIHGFVARTVGRAPR